MNYMDNKQIKRRALGAYKIRTAIEALEERRLLSGGMLADAFNYPLGSFNDANLSLNRMARRSLIQIFRRSLDLKRTRRFQ